MTGNRFYSDFGNKTQIPDALITEISLNPTSFSYAAIVDRYGNEYRSFSADLGWSVGVQGLYQVLFKRLRGYWEGYARIPSSQMTESRLRDIIETDLASAGYEPGYTIQTYILNLGSNTGLNGNMDIFGSGPSLGIGISYGITLHSGKNNTQWDWVDRIPGYDSSISGYDR